MNPDMANTSSDIKTDPPMENRLLKACSSGNVRELKDMVSHGAEILLGTTPQGNTCLHIATMFGHEEFSKEVAALNQSLLTRVNLHGQTALIIAVITGCSSLAETLMKNTTQLREMILKADQTGNNALHHALRNGQTYLAIRLIMAEPDLSRQLNNMNESPMFIAASRGFFDVLERLLELPFSEHQGSNGQNALHAAVIFGNVGITKLLMEKRPKPAGEMDWFMCAPLHHCVVHNKPDLVRVILEHDASLGYGVSGPKRTPYLSVAAFRGCVKVAEEILRHCPDAPYCDETHWSILHAAIDEDKTEFAEFILRNPVLTKLLINMRYDPIGCTALHIAVAKCNPKIVRALLAHKDLDPTIANINGGISVDALERNVHANTLRWSEVFMMLNRAYPTSLYHNIAKKGSTKKAMEQIKSLARTYTNNTSLIAILIATITFAAAFTLPGGYSSDKGSEGLPIMAKKLAFMAFLISDTLAMCSSLSVAFICILARWDDFDLLRHYKESTGKLMWFAYMTTLVAFATGFYTVVAPSSLWLAILVCLLCFSLPILTNLLGKWPIYKLRFRLGRSFQSDMLDII